jgi:hypothetical protein
MAAFNIADRYQVDETIAGQNEEEWKSFTNDKNYTYVVDQQNGNYSNQVSWDLTSVVNQNSWLSIQEGYILMPFSTTIDLGTAVLTAPATFSPNNLSLKNNFINFVDSLQVFVNGEQLVDQTSFSNMPINVMDLLTMSQDNLKLEGSALNICPDTTTSIRYAGPHAAVNGDGYTNNQFLNASNATSLTGLDYSTMNNGLAQRNLNTSTYPQATGTTVGGWPPALGSTVNNFTQILSPYFSQATSSVAVEGAWNYVVYLPLKRLCDLLSKYPYIKGSQIRLLLNFNAGVTTFTTDTTATNALLKMTSYASTAGNTNPVLWNSNYINPLTSTTTPGTMTITTKIQTTTVARVATTTAQKGYATLPNCRIYIPSYKINPTYEERILSNRVQKIRYIDWYQQPIINVANSAQFNQTLTTALTNVKAIIILPFQNGSSNLFSTFTGSQWQSCFDTAPSTTIPGGMLAFQNFNVSVSGINVFNQNANLNYDIWAQEVQRLGLNGALSRELSSGLIDRQTWDWSPFVVADLSRRSESADKTYQSVTVMGTNNSGVSIDYYCFIAFEKEIEIDVLTGAVKRLF